jgi:hypothetical protein
MDGVQELSRPECFKWREIFNVIYFRVHVVQQYFIAKFISTPGLKVFDLSKNLTCANF